jgi:hypothetical protein
MTVRLLTSRHEMVGLAGEVRTELVEHLDERIG